MLRNLLIASALALPLLAEDKPTPTVEPRCLNGVGPLRDGQFTCTPAIEQLRRELLAQNRAPAIDSRGIESNLATPPESTKPTVEQLQAQIAQKDAQIAKLQRKLTVYQESAFRCQDAMLDAQIEAQAKQQPKKPEGK